MSTFVCPHCDKPIDIFGHGEGTKTAIAYGVPVLGEIEIDPRIRIGGDSGKPVAAQGKDAAPGAQPLRTSPRRNLAPSRTQRHLLCTLGYY